MALVFGGGGKSLHSLLQMCKREVVNNFDHRPDEKIAPNFLDFFFITYKIARYEKEGRGEAKIAIIEFPIPTELV